MNGYLTTREAAEILCVKTITVERNCKRGKIKASQTANGRWLIKREDLEAFIKGETNGQ